MQPKRAYIHFNHRLAPTGFLIVPEGVEPDEENQTTLIQTDRDYPGVAAAMGFQRGEVSGNYSDEIAAALRFLRLRADEEFEALADYLPNQGDK